MEVGPITAVARVAHAFREGGRQPAPGEQLSLRVDGVDGDSVLVTTPEGIALRLAGLLHLGRGLTPGDVLLARVLSTAPTLKLALAAMPQAGTGDGAASAASSGAALHLDQAALRRFVARLPDPDALAAAWQRAALRTLSGVPERPLLPLAGNPQAALGAEQVTPAGRWIVPVFLWGVIPAVLQMLPQDEEDARRRPRRSPALVLRLELELRGLGKVAVEVRPLPGGIGLTLCVAGDAATRAIRALIPAIAAALARAGVPVVSLGLRPLPQAGAHPAAVAPAFRSTAMAPAPGLFRAAAEVGVVLLGHTLAGELSPANR